MLVEAETLDLREVDVGELWRHIVGGETDDGVVLLVVDFVEHDGCLGGVNVHLGLHGSELPVDAWLGLSRKVHLVFPDIGD